MRDRGQFAGHCTLCGAPCGHGDYCHTHKWAAGQTEPPKLETATQTLLKMAELGRNGEAA